MTTRITLEDDSITTNPKRTATINGDLQQTPAITLKSPGCDLVTLTPGTASYEEALRYARKGMSPAGGGMHSILEAAREAAKTGNPFDANAAYQNRTQDPDLKLGVMAVTINDIGPGYYYKSGDSIPGSLQTVAAKLPVGVCR